MVLKMRRMNKIHQKLNRNSVNGYRLCSLFVLYVILCLGACTPKHSSYSDFVEIGGDGWNRNKPCEFVPQFGDSTILYEVKVAVCYEHDYPYRNMSLIVDFLNNDSLLRRTNLNMVITDEYGNSQNPGFGIAYQKECLLEECIQVGKVDKIMVWHGLDCDTLNSVTRIGVTLSPVKQ